MSVLSVSTSASHSFGKMPAEYIYLLPKLGVQGDVQYTSILLSLLNFLPPLCSYSHSVLKSISCAPSPTSSPRQVHLIDASLFTTLSKPSKHNYATYQLSPGSLGENITTSNIDLFSLSEGTRLHFGDHEGHAVVRISGLREPRKRLEEWPEGLLDRCSVLDKKGRVVGRKIGVYATVEKEG